MIWLPADAPPPRAVKPRTEQSEVRSRLKEAAADRKQAAADEAINHGKEQCGVIGNGPGDRVIDDASKTPCLWDGCGKLFAARGASANLRFLLRHDS